MKILFFLNGTMWRYTLPEGFKEAGHEVEITDTLEEDIIKAKIVKFHPDFLMSIGWGSEQHIENQTIIRECSKFSNVPHVYWSIEDPAFTHSFSLVLIKKIQPDFVFSVCPSTVYFFRKLGIKSAYMDFGFAPKIHKPVEYDKNYKSTISIVANAYPNILKAFPNHYRNISIKTLIVPLLKNNIRVDFWGNDWDKMNSYLNFNIPNEWIHGFLEYKDANKVYCSSKIVLGLQNYTNQITQRTYEILASGGFLLTSDTPAVRKLFECDNCLIASSSVEKTLLLVNYYLNNPTERIRIANCGKAFLADYRYSYKNKAEYIIKTLEHNNIIKIN